MQKVILYSYSMDFCCGMQLSYLETNCSFQASPLRSLGESKRVCSLRGCCSPQLSLPECSTQCPGIWNFPIWLVGNRYYAGPVGLLSTVTLILAGALSPASASCLTCTVQYSAEHCWETLCKCWTFTLCATLSSLVLYSENPSLLAVSILSALHLLNSGVSHPFLCHGLEAL